METAKVIDVDAHFVEPPHIWNDYLEPAFLDAAPRAVVDGMGKNCTLIGEQLFPFGGGYHELIDTPEKRLNAMDGEGIDAAIIYPSMGLLFGGLKRPDIWAALCRAYNNWARDYCSSHPSRFFAPVMVPQLGVRETIEEARRGLTQLGLKGVFMRPNPIGNRTLDHPAWDPLWDMLEELDAPLVLHEGSSGSGDNMPQVGLDRFASFNCRHIVSHPMEHMMAMLSLIFGRVLERHPKLKVIHVEAGCGWLPYWLERMDHHTSPWHLHRGELPLKMLPSEYFKRQCLVSADPEENILPQVVSAIGDGNIGFSTDYPHPDHKFEGIVAKVSNTPGLSSAARANILGANAQRFFNVG